ncbi:hypothetical protein H072_5205 [Dactylellina haptotyla CBS 200.50]|uniref:Uncharacterized protein n=1 Tax=Dactylellina haptotyla (strain CBS 200.50) TaxID=1284197 RepID=S8AIE9_DACHA|nr:hypothetical protein H072_5205 [Dactylellina haptotyla CBS 200.50]
MAPQGPLTKLYSGFLDNPKTEILHAQAGLHYISTGTSVQSSVAIAGHFQKEALLYTKKEQKILTAVESANALAVELSVIVEFKNGGGSLLPRLDDNFIVDQTVKISMVHMVQFEDGLIKQLRYHWDQASLLKAVSVIGRTGRNWPIRLGEEQVGTIESSAKNVAEIAVASSESAVSTRPSSKNSNHSARESLQLFAPKELGEDGGSAPIAPRGGMKPHTRQLHDIVGEDADDLPAIAPTPKGGKGPGRTFFLGQDIDEAHSTPARVVNVNAKKYQHFDLQAANEETPKVIAPKRMSQYSKPGSTWDFSDFATPNKHASKAPNQDARTFSWSDNEDESSPIKPQQPKKPLPRKGMEASFDIVDETPKKGEQPTKETYVRKGSEASFEFTDDSPAHGNGKAKPTQAHQNMEANWSNSSPLGEPKPVSGFAGIAVGGDGMGGKKGSSLFWDFEDETPKKFNGGGIKIGGNGMGGKIDTNANWAFDESSPAARQGGIKAAGNGMGSKKGTELHWGFEDEYVAQKPVARGINIGGNGMGGRKGTGASWAFGEEEETPAPKKQENAPITTRPFRKASEPTSDLWGY